MSTSPWMPAPGRQEVGPATPYRQQVHPPQYSSGVRMTTPKTGTTPSTSQGQEEPTRGEEGGRGRSSTREPRGYTRDDRSSTRGSVKCHRGIHSANPMDDVSNYVASGWKRDLTHIISCYWKAQVGPLTSSEWTTAIDRFIWAMRARKENEWVDIKELNPLGFMPYVARLFQKVTGVSLSGLDDFTRWVGISGYYHWRLSELGQLHACPHLQGQPVPDGPMS